MNPKTIARYSEEETKTPKTDEGSAPAADETSSEFRSIASGCPHGKLIRVRGKNLPETKAIRSNVVGWYNADRSQRLSISPDEWAEVESA
jgi:hypothetical protein